MLSTPLQHWFEFADIRGTDRTASRPIHLRSERCVTAAGEPGEPGAYEELLFTASILVPRTSLPDPSDAIDLTRLDGIPASTLMADPAEPIAARHPLARLRDAFTHRSLVNSADSEGDWELDTTLQTHIDELDTPEFFSSPLSVVRDTASTMRQVTIRRGVLEQFLENQESLLFHCSYRYRLLCVASDESAAESVSDQLCALNDDQLWRGRVFADNHPITAGVVDYISELYSQTWIMPTDPVRADVLPFGTSETVLGRIGAAG